MPTGDGPPPVLEARGLTAGYGDLAAVRGIALRVAPGEIVALFGANGAGKTTTLLALVGELPRGAGEVRWLGRPTRSALHQLARDGLAFVPEQRSVLASMSVRDNLLLGRGGVDAAVEIFPELRPLLGRRAGLLSGGEQQMLTLARALAARPAALLVDELSLGLAPIVVERLFAALQDAARVQRVAVLLVEQEARRALGVADRWYLLRGGEVVASGDAAGADRLEREYLAGISPAT
ncbi:ATP-binding cassette domain-containing protein [Pseudofrankia sp. DC12]|uniref:ABC transporter ATP-binding protein n=1 Tax=Pseudofrankia sp. DC12 TaxID=683315 RepID=UPI0005F7A99F|nr:ATP-binding cassette domain-containing protein [Pseudofrankia sp. DC12]